MRYAYYSTAHKDGKWQEVCVEADERDDTLREKTREPLQELKSPIITILVDFNKQELISL